ncbi:MAG: hypothetical protein V1761_01040 [bacterium]
MANMIKDLPQKLRELGLKAFKSIEKGVVTTRKGIENTFLTEELRRRFNLENPYKFEIRDAKAKTNLFTGLAAKNAKRYEDDDLFVFFGLPEDTGLVVGTIIKDLSDGAEYAIETIIAVTMTVTLEDKGYDVPATAVKRRAL